MSTETERVTANGLEFECLRRGSGDRLALLLHGFPDDAESMRPLMTRLSEAGFTTVAPYMRGYGPTDRAPDGNYTSRALAEDAIELSEKLGSGDVVLVGHDWGAAAGYLVGILAPDHVSHVVTMASPHSFAQRGLDNPRQWFRSWYVFFFQLPHLPEYALRAGDFALIEHLWETWSPGWDYSEDRIESVKETFRTPGTVEAALEYYRQFGRQVIERMTGDRMTSDATIEIPTLVIAGEDDGCIGPEMFEGVVDETFEAESRSVMVENAGHFMHRERPDTVTEEVLSFVER